MSRLEVCLEKKTDWTEKEDKQLSEAQDRWINALRAANKVRQ